MSDTKHLLISEHILSKHVFDKHAFNENALNKHEMCVQIGSAQVEPY